MKYKIFIFAVLAAAVCIPSLATAQVAIGGGFTLAQQVIANGGGPAFAGGGWKLGGTFGQPVAGGNNANGGAGFNLVPGFWNPLVGPVAAGVAIGGRVINSDGLALRNVKMVLTGGGLGAPRVTQTNAFGYFSFEDVTAGQTYILSAKSRKFTFDQSSQVVTLVDNITDLVFVSNGQY